MRFYETLYLLTPELSQEEYKEVLEKFNSIIEKNGGVVIRLDEWGKKELAYQVRKFDKGFYVLLQYCGPPGITFLLERDLRLDDRVMKYQTIKLRDKADPDELKREFAPQEVAEPEEEEAAQPEDTGEATEQVQEGA
ncbi:MAG: 30S ribosomal protein S6 [Deltaproteobacteria bacterium]|nr:MAG: 30S ribosomal protein S6 [Deltaproteobacteria bacterium]RLB86117.1 MAG: 30S ribosomal protein S6 [Deltaproteobacteria bacterium]